MSEKTVTARLRVAFEVELSPVAAEVLRQGLRAPKVQAWLRTLLADALETLLRWMTGAECFRVHVVSGSVEANNE